MAKSDKPEAEEHVAPAAPEFSKTQLLRSAKYAARRDLLSVLLVDNRAYTFAKVDAMLKNYDERKI